MFWLTRAGRTLTGMAAVTLCGAGTLVAAAVGAVGSPAASASTTGTAVWVTNSLATNTSGNSTITAYDSPSTGAAPTATLQAASKSGPTAAAFDASGDLWVAEYDAGDIFELPPSALTSGTTSLPTTAFVTGLVDPVGIGVDPSGNLWVVTDGSVTGGVAPSLLEYKYDPSTHTVSSTATVVASGTATLGLPGNLTINKTTGDVWVSDSQNDKIYEFTPSGGGTPQVTLSSLALTGTATTLSYPAGLTFDSAGNLWVADRGANQVVEFTAGDITTSGSPAANITLSNDGAYSADGETFAGTIYGPASLAFDSSGNLWVANESGQGPGSTNTNPVPPFSVVEFTAAQVATTSSPYPPAVTLDDSHSGVELPSGVLIGPAPTSSTGGGTTGTGTTGGGTTGSTTSGGTSNTSSPAPVVTPAPAPASTPPAPQVGPAPQGISPSLVGTPSSALVQAGLATTLSATVGATDISVTVPSGALPTGTAVSIYPIGKASALASGLKNHQASVSAFSVTWQASDASTPTASSPVSMTITNPGIAAGDTLYEYANGKLTAAGRASTAGTLAVKFTGAPTFLLAQSPRMTAAAGSAKLAKSAVMLKLSCVGGGSCIGSGNLSVVRKIDGHLKHVVLASSRIGLRKGVSRNVGFRLDKSGMAALSSLAKGAKYRMTLTIDLSGGHKVVENVTVRSNGALS